jgi:hypothetical protein
VKVAEIFAALSLKPDTASFDAAEKLIGGLKTGLMALGAAAVGATVALGAMIQSTINEASAAVDAAARLGITAEQVQELGYAASLSGGSMETLEGGLRALSRTLASAKDGSKEARSALRDLGLSMSDASVKSGDIDAVLMAAAERISAMPDGYEKGALAMKLFGRAGTQLLPLLNEGADGISKLRQEARELGVVIDNDTAGALEALGDDQDRLKASLTGIRNQIVVALLPTLQKVAKHVLEWIKNNRELIKLRVHQVITLLGKALMLVGKAIGYVVDAFGFLRDNIEWVAVAIGALVGALLIFKATAIAAGIASGAAFLIGLWPLALLMAAIAAVILIVEDLWTGFNGGESVLFDLWKSFEEWVGTKITGGIKKYVGQWIEAITIFWGFTKTVWGFWYGQFKDMVDKISWVFDKVDKYKGYLKGGALGGITTAIGEAIGFGEDEATHDTSKMTQAERDAIVANGGIKPMAPVVPTASTTVPYKPVSMQPLVPQFNATINLSGSEATPEILTSKLDDWWDGKLRTSGGAL